MTELSLITALLNDNLTPSKYEDSSLNGLQVEGTNKISSVAVAVDAGEAVIEKAISKNANLLIVHHGLFWQSCQPITGSRKRVIKLLLDNEINLYAAHLPLDAHMTLGNNAGIAELLGLKNAIPSFFYRNANIGCIAEGNGSTCDEMIRILEMLPGNSPILTLPFGPKQPKRIGIVSGSGMNFLESWEELGFDTFITGEPRQSAYHFARENGLNVICAGHYRTETLGVQNLGKLISDSLNTPWHFIDVPTGI